MKIEFYFDVWPWSKSENIIVTSNKSSLTSKSPDCKRYKLTIHIPDPTQVDKEITITPDKIEEIKE